MINSPTRRSERGHKLTAGPARRNSRSSETPSSGEPWGRAARACPRSGLLGGLKAARDHCVCKQLAGVSERIACGFARPERITSVALCGKQKTYQVDRSSLLLLAGWLEGIDTRRAWPQRFERRPIKVGDLLACLVRASHGRDSSRGLA